MPTHVMDVIEEELGKLSFLDPHSSEFKYKHCVLSAFNACRHSYSSKIRFVTAAVHKCSIKTEHIQYLAMYYEVARAVVVLVEQCANDKRINIPYKLRTTTLVGNFMKLLNNQGM